MSMAKLIVAIAGIVISAYLAVAAGDHFFPFFPNSHSLSPGYRHTWHGQVPGTSFQLTLTLGAGHVNQRVGSISSPDLGCAEVVYLQNTDNPVTLRLDSSGASLGCDLASFFIGSATISLIDSSSLRFTVDMPGGPESCDFSL
jgi:hypothetical protein